MLPMTLLTWAPVFEMGVNVLDEQHHSLFDAINALYNAMQMSKGIEEVDRTLLFMYEYTVFHFGEEEAQMGRHGYPGLDEHQRLHIEWIQKCAQLKKKQEDGSFLVSSELLRFLANWISTHIKVDDKAFGEFMKLRGLV
jgi:hemerythrin-like metal-binding protein